MLVFNLTRLLKIKGISNPTRFFMNMGYSKSIAYRMSKNDTYNFTTNKLEQLCLALNCSPNDLFEYIPEKNSTITPSHPLNHLIRHDKTQIIYSLLHELPIEKILELADLVKKEENQTNNDNKKETH